MEMWIIPSLGIDEIEMSLERRSKSSLGPWALFFLYQSVFRTRSEFSVFSGFLALRTSSITSLSLTMRVSWLPIRSMISRGVCSTPGSKGEPLGGIMARYASAV
jgi:hypothetical protein